MELFKKEDICPQKILKAKEYSMYLSKVLFTDYLLLISGKTTEEEQAKELMYRVLAASIDTPITTIKNLSEYKEFCDSVLKNNKT